MAASDPPPGARGDEAELFRAYNDELMRVVARNVHGLSQQTIEDACAFAWAQFMAYQPDRDRDWQGWTVRTAEQEAWALSRREQRNIRFKDSTAQPRTSRLTWRRPTRSRSNRTSRTRGR